MATREFESPHVNILAEAALVGLNNHIENCWVRECRNQYKWHHEASKTRWARFWHHLWTGVKLQNLGTIDMYIEERRTWPYSEYSTRYTMWEAHVMDFDSVRDQFRRLVRISEENVQAGLMTRLDDSEYNLLRRYSKVERS